MIGKNVLKNWDVGVTLNIPANITSLRERTWRGLKKDCSCIWFGRLSGISLTLSKNQGKPPSLSDDQFFHIFKYTRKYGKHFASAKAGDANHESFIRMLTLLSHVSAELCESLRLLVVPEWPWVAEGTRQIIGVECCIVGAAAFLVIVLHNNLELATNSF